MWSKTYPAVMLEIRYILHVCMCTHRHTHTNFTWLKLFITADDWNESEHHAAPFSSESGQPQSSLYDKEYISTRICNSAGHQNHGFSKVTGFMTGDSCPTSPCRAV